MAGCGWRGLLLRGEEEAGNTHWLLQYQQVGDGRDAALQVSVTSRGWLRRSPVGGCFVFSIRNRRRLGACSRGAGSRTWRGALSEVAGTSSRGRLDRLGLGQGGRNLLSKVAGVAGVPGETARWRDGEVGICPVACAWAIWGRAESYWVRTPGLPGGGGPVGLENAREPEWRGGGGGGLGGGN